MIELRGLTKVFGSKWFGSRRAVDDLTCSIEPGVVTGFLGLLGSTPRVGEHLGPLLPFTNAYEFTGVPWFSGSPLWWGPLGALLYFTPVVAVVFLAAAVIINRRDP
jgi:hypothetical protein